MINKKFPFYFKFVLLCNKNSEERFEYSKKYNDFIINEHWEYMKVKQNRKYYTDKEIHIPTTND